MERLRKHGILVHTRLAEGSRKKSEIVVLTRKCASSALHKAFEQILPGGRAKTPMILPVLR
jgi:hypothetical protein